MFDHLRTKQQQVWSSLSAILTFDGIMSATVAVLGSGQATVFYDPKHSPSALWGSMALYLVSAIVVLIGLNLHGEYSKVTSADDAENVYLGTIKNGATVSLIGMWTSVLGMIFLVIALVA